MAQFNGTPNLMRIANLRYKNVCIDLISKHPWYIGAEEIPLQFLPPGTRSPLRFPDHGATPMVCLTGDRVLQCVRS